MPGHVRRWIYVYSKQLSKGQNRYSADADWDVLDGDAYWRRLANTTEPFVCGLMSNFFNHLLLLGRIAVVSLRTYRCGLLLPSE